ncbi:MAG: hypothetical protein WB441_08940 [Nocardioidaceae bacterium]
MGKKKSLRDRAGDLSGSLSPHVESARGKAGPVIADAREKAAPYVADARDRAAHGLADARVKAAPVLADVRDRTAPVLADVRDRTAPVLADARDRFTGDVVPAVAAALAAVDESTEDVRHEAGRRGKAVVAALKGEVEPPRRTHRLRNLLLLLGLGGAIFAASRKLGSQQSSTWQSAPTPAPTPDPTTATSPSTEAAAAGGAHLAQEEPMADDVAASDPAEAASDATDRPHPATTPDDPAEQIDVDRQ